MKLLAILFLFPWFYSCNSSKEITRDHVAIEPSTVTISLLIETNYCQCNLNDVISACNGIKPFRTFSVNYLSTEKMELRLVYGQISAGQKEEIYNQLNGMAGVRVVNTSDL